MPHNIFILLAAIAAVQFCSVLFCSQNVQLTWPIILPTF